MKPTLRLPLALVVFLLISTVAHAQTSVYGSVNLTRYGYSSSASGEFNYDPNSSNFSLYNPSFGIGGGGTYLFSNRSRFKPGIDLRGIYSPGSKGGGGGFASLRLAFVPHTHPVSPYLQIGGGAIFVHLAGGYVVSDANGNILRVVDTSHITGGAADLLFGLQIRTSSSWSIRALEFGGYAGPHVELSTIGAGVVYTFGDHKHPTP